MRGCSAYLLKLRPEILDSFFFFPSSSTLDSRVFRCCLSSSSSSSSLPLRPSVPLLALQSLIAVVLFLSQGFAVIRLSETCVFEAEFLGRRREESGGGSERERQAADDSLTRRRTRSCRSRQSAKNQGIRDDKSSDFVESSRRSSSDGGAREKVSGRGFRVELSSRWQRLFSPRKEVSQ